MIVPTKHADVPVAPNFFLKAKGPGGSTHMARRQAYLNGAYGARAMHSLQSHSEKKPVYDSNTYTYSSTYHAGTGTLQLYGHHVTAPTDPEGRPGYHMAKLRGFDLTDSHETCVAGIAAPPCHSVNAAESDEQPTRRRFHHNTDKTFGRTFNDRVNSACIICTNSNIKPVGQPAYLPSLYLNWPAPNRYCYKNG